MTRADAPEVLEYGDIRWELEASGGGTRLTLWHNIDRRFISWGAAGWHICFDVLDRLLSGTPIGRIAGGEAMKFGGWQRLNAEYAKQFGVETPGVGRPAPRSVEGKEEEDMESTLHKPALAGAQTTAKAWTIAYWIVTALFCLQMSFTAYAQLRLPEVAAAFTHLGFPGYFRVELSWAKLLGVVLLLAPVPARLKEWAYAGFAIDLASALYRPPRGGRWPGGVGLGGGQRRALGALVLLLAPPASRRREPESMNANNKTLCSHCRGNMLAKVHAIEFAAMAIPESSDLLQAEARAVRQ